MAILPFDTETGEVVVNEYRCISRKQSDAYNEKHRLLESEKVKSSTFTFAMMENIQEVSAVLTTAQCGYLLLLQCYIEYDTGVLINPNKSPMKPRDMIDVLQLKNKRQTFYDFFNTCLDNDIIFKLDDGKYAINSQYHFKGATTNKKVVRSYSAKVRQVYDEVKAADLGIIYRMLPYVHFRHNGLCADPFSDDTQWFTMGELADMVGVSRQHLSQRLPKITIGNEYVIARITTGGDTFFMFNPMVFRRRVREPNDTERALFHVKKRKGKN